MKNFWSLFSAFLSLTTGGLSTDNSTSTLTGNSTTLTSGSSTTNTTNGCKSIPGSAGWPSLTQWSSFNQSLGGKLIKTIPPGGVCHSGQPNYDMSACAATNKSWSTEDFHAQNPFSFDYNDVTCFPDPRAPCSAAGYPVYVVDARTVQDIQVSVKFAAKYNIRLVVKGTGHDFNFRSNAPNSLRIWTHNMQGAEFVNSFTPKGGPNAFPVVTLQAGMQWGDIYKQAAAKGVEVVGGSDPSVGLGGFLGGAGHGPLTASRGLAADQVLEYQVVTPDGEIRIVNAYQQKDLFWALCGGGASTFAVMASVTVKTFPLQTVTQWGFEINSTNNDALWDATTYFHTQLVQLNEQGLTSYYYVFPSAGPKQPGSLLGIFLSYGNVNVTELVQPLVKGMNTQPWTNLTTGFGGITTPYDNIYDYTNNGKHTETVGFPGRLGSRLLDEHALTSNPVALKAALQACTPAGTYLMGHLTAGKGPREAQPEGGGNSVLPAWRYSYVHMVGSAIWPLGDTATQEKATDQLRDERIAALRALAPETGSYMSEGDPTEPNWQTTFWGANYPALLALKKRWDPKGMFYCVPCVGSELYTVRDDGAVCPL